MKQFHEVIREAREAKRWSIGQLSYETGLLPLYLSAVERGEEVPGIYDCEKLARALDLSLDNLTDIINNSQK